MRKKVAEPERLDKYLVNYGDNNDDFKALVLKLLAEFQDVEKIHQLTKVPISTIYLWLEEWNKKRKCISQSAWCRRWSHEAFAGIRKASFAGTLKTAITLDDARDSTTYLG